MCVGGQACGAGETWTAKVPTPPLPPSTSTDRRGPAASATAARRMASCGRAAEDGGRGGEIRGARGGRTAEMLKGGAGEGT